MREGQPGPNGREHVLAGILAVLADARLLTLGVELARLAVSEFFLPQFETRLFPGTRPVVTIGDPLDDRIPFRPERIRSYLGFITVWIGSLGGLSRLYGGTGRSQIARSLSDFCRLYRAAGSVYRRCQSTTRRPRRLPLSIRYLLVRLFDPHLHCIPSLHVLLLCCNYRNLERLAADRRDPTSEVLAADARRAALRITRSVLLVKQHSLADIGPSLYMLCELFAVWDRRDAERFVRDVFRGFPQDDAELSGVLERRVMRGYRDLERLRRANPGATIEDLVVGYLRSWRPPSGGRRKPA